MNAVLDTAPFRNAGAETELFGAQQALLDAVLQAAPGDPQVLARQAHLLQLFHDVLARAPPAFQAVVDKLLWMNGFAPERATPHDVVIHQRRALSALVVIARKPACAALLLKWFADLSPMVLALCQARPAHAPALLELLVTICNALPAAADRINYALRLIGQDLNEFVALDIGRFLKMFGLSAADGSAVLNLDEAVPQGDARHRLLMILNTIQFVLRSVNIDDNAQQVLYQALSGLCATACAILSALHALYSPTRTATASVLVRAVFEPWSTEGDRFAAQAHPNRKDVLETLRTQAYAVRDQCYLLLQSALASPYVFTGAGQHVLVLVTETCLTDACLGLGEHALHPSRRIPILSKVWATFLEKCPVQHPMFLAVFARLIRVQAGPLAQAWSAVMIGADAGGGIDREVFEENALREYTRALMGAIHSALSSHNWVAFSDAPSADKARDPACRAVCDDPDLTRATLGVLQMGLQVPDSVTQARCASLIARLLPMLVTPGQASDLFVPVMEVCVRLLSTMTKSAATSSSTGQALLGLTFEVLRQFAAVDRAPFGVLLRHPGVVAEEVDALRDALASSAQATKVMRAATRSFIFAYVTERQGSAPVRDLPSHLVLPDKAAAADSTPPSPLPDLFP